MRYTSRVILLLFVPCFFTVSCHAARSTPDGEKGQTEFMSLFRNEGAPEPDEAELIIPDTARAYFNYLSGEFALKEERFDEALKHFEEAAKLETDSAPGLRRRLAQLYIRAGRLEEAEAEIARGLSGAADDIQLLQLQGSVAASRKDIPRAIEACRRLIELQAPDNEEAYVMLASLYAQNGEFQESRRVLQDLLTQQPNSVFGYYYLGRVAEAIGDFEQAKGNYRKALAINPSAKAIELDLARVLARQRRLAEAEGLLNEIIRENPQNIDARRLLAQIYLQENKLPKAREQFEALGELESDPKEARLKVALIKIREGDLQGAELDLTSVLARDPNNSPARYYLASVYAGLHRIDDAVAESRKIPSGDKLFSDARLFAAFLLQREKRHREAIAAIEEALREEPKNPKLLVSLATVRKESGDLPAAVEAIERAIALEPENDQHYFTLGVFHDELGKHREAMAAMRRAIELNPKNAIALNYLAYTLAERNEDLPEALALVKRALALDANNGFYIDTLAWVYYRQGRYRDALREVERAVRLVPDDAVILEHLGMTQLKLGRTREAIVTLKRALANAPKSDDKRVGERVKVLLDELSAK